MTSMSFLEGHLQPWGEKSQTCERQAELAQRQIGSGVPAGEQHHTTESLTLRQKTADASSSTVHLLEDGEHSPAATSTWSGQLLRLAQAAGLGRGTSLPGPASLDTSVLGELGPRPPSTHRPLWLLPCQNWKTLFNHLLFEYILYA